MSFETDSRERIKNVIHSNKEDDPWEKYYARFEEPDCEIVPVGAVLTMAGTGSEMNAGGGHYLSGKEIEDRACVCG